MAYELGYFLLQSVKGDCLPDYLDVHISIYLTLFLTYSQ